MLLIKVANIKKRICSKSYNYTIMYFLILLTQQYISLCFTKGKKICENSFKDIN